MSSTDYDVFLSHNSADKFAVEELARRLVKENVKPWLDKWNLIPGDPWQKALELALDRCATCAVFIGPSGISPWQNEEMRTAIDRRVREGRFRVIPVLLPGAQREKRSRLPAFMVATTWVEFRKSLDDEQAFHRLVCGIRGIEPGPGSGKPLIEGMRPYRGLKPFQPEHAPLFFGREALTEWLINELQPSSDRKEANRFLAIIGASGSGKSSLALAGLIPALQKGAIEGSQEWPIVILRPGQDPLESLAVALSANSRVGEFIPSVKGIISEFSDDPRTLHWTISKALHGASETSRTFVLIDQFEEIFTLCQEDGLRTALIENMLYATSIDRGKTVAVLTMRADFYSKCVGFETLAAALSDHQVLVGPMTDEELRQAIQRPAQLVGCELEVGLVEALINDFNNQPGALPLLQHALSELWEGRKDRWLTRDAYEAIGKLEGALENYANSVFEKFNGNEQEVCRRIFLRLTQPGEGTEDTKRRSSVKDLIPADAEDDPTFRVIHDLADSRLITTEGEKDRPEDGFVEVAHEALIRGWDRLRIWLDEDRDFLLWQKRMRTMIAEWERTGHDAGTLLRGVPLIEAEQHFTDRPDDLTSTEKEFIQTSQAKRDRETAAQEEGRRRELETAQRLARARRQRIWVLAAGLVVTFIITIVAVIQWNRAEKQTGLYRKAAEEAQNQKNFALDARASAEQQQKEAQKQADLARNAAANAQKQENIALEAKAIAEQQRKEAEKQAELARRGTYNIQMARVQDIWQRDPTQALELLNDLTRVPMDLRDFTWGFFYRLSNKTRMTLTGHGSLVLSVAFSPDGKTLASASSDQSIKLWEAETGQERTTLTGHGSVVYSVTFSPDGKTLASASNDETIKLWEAETGQERATLTGHTHRVYSVAFSPDSKTLASASDDKTIKLWEAETGQERATLTGHTRQVRSVAFSPDGKTLASASLDKTIKLWEAEIGEIGSSISEALR